MLSKNQIKLINALRQKKYRNSHKMCIAEGTKVIAELYHAGWKLHAFFSTQLIQEIPEDLTTLIQEVDLHKISGLTTPNLALALFYIPESKAITTSTLIVALDQIQDPGNLGTIIRICDWYGIQQMVCSQGTVDAYNPKVIQSSMGSIARVQINYTDLASFFNQHKSLPIYGAYLEGDNIYKNTFFPQGILLFGNESNGISNKLEPFVSHKICIPRFGTMQQTESLNVAVATAIIVSEFFRNSIEK